MGKESESAQFEPLPNRYRDTPMQPNHQRERKTTRTWTTSLRQYPLSHSLSTQLFSSFFFFDFDFDTDFSFLSFFDFLPRFDFFFFFFDFDFTSRSFSFRRFFFFFFFFLASSAPLDNPGLAALPSSFPLMTMSGILGPAF